VPAFRRIDLQSDRAARHLQTAARTILRALPNPSVRATDTILSLLTRAYGVLPLHSITMMLQAITRAPLPRRAETLRATHVMIEQVLRDLGRIGTREPTPDESFGTMASWLEAIGDKGWKVQRRVEQPDTACVDGFELSARYLGQIAAQRTCLVARDQQYGAVSLPVLLLHGYAIPPPVLRGWSEATPRLEVTVVYGQYVAIQPIACVGLHSSIVEMKNGLALDRFAQVAACLDLDAGAVIVAPRRVGQHYYCPLFDQQDEARRHFRDWHPIVAD
jgi:hypothetical protein